MGSDWACSQRTSGTSTGQPSTICSCWTSMPGGQPISSSTCGAMRLCDRAKSATEAFIITRELAFTLLISVAVTDTATQLCIRTRLYGGRIAETQYERRRLPRGLAATCATGPGADFRENLFV